jgi:hypothetical protein
MPHFNPFTITVGVYSYSHEILWTSEVPRDDSLFTAIAVNYPFTRWDYMGMHETNTIVDVYDSEIETQTEEVVREQLQWLGDRVKNARWPRKMEISLTLKHEEDNATAPRSQSSSSFDVVDLTDEREQHPSSFQVLGTMSSLLLHS